MKETFEFKGKKLSYDFEWIRGTLWVHVNGKTLAIEPASSRKNRRQEKGVAHNKVLAPMPGKITKVLVKEGDVVKKGQAVVVMEAMKMEYTLKAELEGPVEKVQAQVNTQVSLGDLLVQIQQESK